MKRLILAVAAILLFAFSSWAVPVAPGSSASPNVRASHHARLMRVKQKNRHKRAHYKHHRRSRNRHNST
jgi:hypothetical protein